MDKNSKIKKKDDTRCGYPCAKQKKIKRCPSSVDKNDNMKK